MKEALVSKDIGVEIVDSPIPEPGPDDVVTKVVFSGSNPKVIVSFFRKIAESSPHPLNTGDDIAGTVHSVGANVTEFRPGDRVAAFHRMFTPHGSFAEYALSPSSTTFHIPRHTSFEEAASIPLAAMTAAVGLFVKLGLPMWKDGAAPKNDPDGKYRGGLLIYGASGAVGAYTVKLARRIGIHPLICIAGAGTPYVQTLIDASAGDMVIDYRTITASSPPPPTTSQYPLRHAFDAVSLPSTLPLILHYLSPTAGSQLTSVLPLDKAARATLPPGVRQTWTMVGAVHDDSPEKGLADFGFTWFRLFGRGLSEGWMQGHPTRVVDGGLEGVQGALRALKEGKAGGATKSVFRIAREEEGEKGRANL